MYLQWNQWLVALVNIADQQLWGAQARYKRHYYAQLRRTVDNLLSGDFVFVEISLTDQQN